MEGDDASTAAEVDAHALWQTFQERRASVEGRFGARLDQFLTNYALNYWFTHWYTQSPDLLTYQSKLLVNLAALRFLLISHPHVYSEALALDDETQATDLLDRTAVKIFYPFGRAVEHDQRFAGAIQSFLDRNGIRTLAHHVFLLKS